MSFWENLSHYRWHLVAIQTKTSANEKTSERKTAATAEHDTKMWLLCDFWFGSSPAKRMPLSVGSWFVRLLHFLSKSFGGIHIYRILAFYHRRALNEWMQCCCLHSMQPLEGLCIGSLLDFDTDDRSIWKLQFCYAHLILLLFSGLLFYAYGLQFCYQISFFFLA